MLHGLLREMVRRGHTCDVFVARGVFSSQGYDGVGVHRYVGHRPLAGVDVLLTHLDNTREATVVGRQTGAPVVHLIHNDRQLKFHSVQPVDADLIVVNSYWLKAIYDTWWPGHIAVVHPPVEPVRYRVKEFTDDRVTLMNLSEAKGGPLFWRLAAMMPHRRFLAVAGAYALQEIPPELPPNVILVPNTAHVVEDVYARTKILLMPSSYESWGRCAIEAACSGIPTIAHATDGLVESLGTAGLFIHRDHVNSWARSIDALYEDRFLYDTYSCWALERAAALDPRRSDFDRFEKLLRQVVAGEIRATAIA